MLNKILYFFKKITLKPDIFHGKYGIKYYSVPYSSLDKQVTQHGVIDDWEYLKNIAKLIPPEGTVVDIGANVGLLSLLFAKFFVPKGRVYAFEPDPENIKQLEKNITLNSINNIIALPIALQNNPNIKNINFNIRRSIDGDGNLNKGLSSIKNISLHKKSRLKVKTSTLDEQININKIKKIDFLKIDVEGAEIDVLEGSLKTLMSFHPIIYYEYSNTLDNIMKEQNTIKSFNLLKKLNYEQYYIDNKFEIKKLFEPNENLHDTNIICFYKNT